MRDSIKLGLIGCLLLFLLGCRKHVAGDEVVVKQRTTAVLPGLDGTIKVRVGDIKRGKTADVEIIGPDSVTLATKKGAQVGDRIAFAHDGKKYEIEVIHYFDEIGPGDSATFKVIALAKDSPSDAKVKIDLPHAKVNEAPPKAFTYVLKERRAIQAPMDPPPPEI